MTPDGRFVLFSSRANNLVSTGTNSPFPNQIPPKLNVFLRDRLNETTTLVSVNQQGTGPGNGDSIPTALSTNGQFALFESAASDLTPGDTNNATDIFLRDLVHGTNQLISVNTNGGFGNGASWESTMTPDGRYVAFASAANNLTPNDRNGLQDIFVRDTAAGLTRLASPGALGGRGLPTGTIDPQRRSDSPQITPDGHFVVFRSSATNLLYSNTVVVNEVYIRDLTLGATTLVSTNAHNLLPGAPSSYNQVVSDDGQYVAFESSVNRVGVIQRYNLQTGFTDVIYTNAVASYTYNHFHTIDMTPDGRWVAFVGNTDTSGTASGVFVWDAQSGVATLVSTNLGGAVSAYTVCEFPTLDASGRWVAFLSTAPDLATNAVAGGFHLWLHDAWTGALTLVDADTNGVGTPKDWLTAPRLTPDGRFAAFDCSDGDLVPNDNNHAFDVFATDLAAGTNEMVSVRHPASPSQTPAGATLGANYSLSTDGRFVAFSATGDGLLAGGYTNVNRGVFVRDQLTGSTALASVDVDGLGGADGWSFDPSISGDGRYVAFTSRADNLVAGDGNADLDVFVRDLQAGLTTLVSANWTGAGPGSGPSYAPQISTAGRYVLFHSKAYDLTPGRSVLAGGSDNLYLRDLQLGTNYSPTTYASNPSGGSQYAVSAAAMTADARWIGYALAAHPFYVLWDSQALAPVFTNTTGATVSNLVVSPDGNRIAYLVAGGFYATDRQAQSNWLISASAPGSRAGLQFTADSRYLVYATAGPLVAGDTNGASDVYLHDFQTHGNVLISQSCRRPGAANGPSDSPAISADGRFVAFRSLASDLVFGDTRTNALPEIFVFDRQTDTTTLIGASLFGPFAGNNRSLAPAFSGDSQTLVFQSWASDLTAQDFNQSANLFALKLYGSIASPPFVGQILFAPAPGQSPLLAWPATAGINYQVQFKNTLNDPSWHNLNCEVTILGDRAYATDFTAGPGPRFYRIIAF